MSLVSVAALFRVITNKQKTCHESCQKNVVSMDHRNGCCEAGVFCSAYYTAGMHNTARSPSTPEGALKKSMTRTPFSSDSGLRGDPTH